MTTRTDAPAADAVAHLRDLREHARGLGGPERVARQHARGLLTARERIDLLLDPGSELPLGTFLTSGVPGEEARTLGNGLLTGFGEIDGRPVGYYASDATVKGGSLGGGNMLKKTRIHRICEQAGLPLFALIQGGGGRITDVLSSRFAGVPGGELGERLAFPNRWNHFAAVLGNYYAPWDAADADFCIMTQNSNLSIASPPVVQEASGEFVSPFDIGGAEIQGRVTGQIDAVVPDDAAAIALLRAHLLLRAGQRLGATARRALRRPRRPPRAGPARDHPRPPQPGLRRAQGHPPRRRPRQLHGVDARLRAEPGRRHRPARRTRRRDHRQSAVPQGRVARRAGGHQDRPHAARLRRLPPAAAQLRRRARRDPQRRAGAPPAADGDLRHGDPPHPRARAEDRHLPCARATATPTPA